jgi:hypothetical protein
MWPWRSRSTTSGSPTSYCRSGSVATIAKPVLLAQRYDTSRYATLAGVIAVPMTLAKATAAPLAAAALHAATGSYTPVVAAVAACCAIAAAAISAAGHRSVTIGSAQGRCAQ